MRLRTRTPRNSHRRGVAFVEAIGVIIAFLAVTIGASYIWGVYLTRHDVVAEARYKVWSHALDGCNGSPQDVPTKPTRGGTIRDQSADHLGGDSLTADERDLVEAGQSATAEAKGNIAYANVARPFQAGRLAPSMQAETITVTREVHCNEKVRDGSVWSAFGSIYSIVENL
jgi:hypothetical protein